LHKLERLIRLADLAPCNGVNGNGAAEHSVLRSATQVLLNTGPSVPARDFVNGITEAALASYVADPSANEDARGLSRMREALAVGGPLETMTVGELGARARAPDHVMAATIHAAKGLEFDVVVMIGVDEGGLPGFSPNDEEVLEGRRKFYVAITRAREQVHMVYTDCRVSRRGKTYSVRPSPFIAELHL
jgi:DNA helicase-2/ATP-dependent DNA helicase PcrA